MFTVLLRNISICLIALQIFVADVLNQATPRQWETKAIDKWDKKDVDEILEGSAWGRTIRAELSVSTDSTTLTTRSWPIITLRSSLLVRLALVRRIQIISQYDSMDKDGQKKIDLATKPILICDECDRYYIVSVNGVSDMLANGESVKRREHNIILSNEKGELRRLAKFLPQTKENNNEALFFFPRLDEKGVPLLSKDNSRIVFKFEDINSRNDIVLSAIRRVEFKVQDIIRSDKVIF